MSSSKQPQLHLTLYNYSSTSQERYYETYSRAGHTLSERNVHFSRRLSHVFIMTQLQVHPRSCTILQWEGFSDHFQLNTSRGIELTQHHLMSTCSGTLPLIKPLYMCAFCWDLTLWFCGLGFWVWSWKGRLRIMTMATKGALGVALAVVIALRIVLTVLADGECSVDAPCRDENNCCSQFGFCGTGETHCGNGCQAGPCTGRTAPNAPSVGAGLGDILTRDLFEQFFPGHLSFYGYDQLIEAANLFPQFGTTGDTDTRKREIAAFAAHVTQETSGLKEIVEQTDDRFCDTSRPEFPCGDKKFNGRGPLQLSWNFNYGPCGNYLNIDLLGNPDLVATDPLISFKASLWFWNQYGDNVIPHMHDVIVGNWKPSGADQDANRVPGFGVTIVIINGGLECNRQSAAADNRVRYFTDFCSRLGISPGDNLDCKTMRPFYSVNLVGVS